MQSKITIEIDFDNNNQPVIQILSRESDDVRDKLIKSFLQMFRHASNWCRIDWVQNHVVNDKTDFQRIFIRPIPPQELRDVAQKIIERAAIEDPQKPD